jgi:hypothetical protein
MPPAQNIGTGSSPASATSATTSSGACSSFAAAGSSARQRREPLDPARDVAKVTDGLDDVPGARLALRPDHRRALADPPESLAQVRGPADERDLERVLLDVVRLVRRGEHLGFVDVVDLERLQDLRLREVTDASLRHDRDGHGLLDALDHRRIAHPRNAAVAADVSRDPLQGHHGNRARLLGDPGLVGGDDVHDHAALEHLGKAALYPECGPFAHRAQAYERARPPQPCNPSHAGGLGDRASPRSPRATYFSLKARMRSLNAALSRE